jgi:hypothetical protein
MKYLFIPHCRFWLNIKIFAHIIFWSQGLIDSFFFMVSKVEQKRNPEVNISKLKKNIFDL